MTDLAASAEGGNVAPLKAAIDRLAHGTEDFAARRMDRSIRTALAGRRVEDVLAK
jgi:molecular chaperone HscA